MRRLRKEERNDVQCTRRGIDGIPLLHGNASLCRSLAYLRPATSFRSTYAYDNILYVAAGQLIEDVSGRPWEEFVRDNLLVPAGMRTATSSLTASRTTD